MFDEIINHPDLFAICCQSCHENETQVYFDENLLIKGELDSSKIIILKPDLFYNSKNIGKAPPAPDCLILVNCSTTTGYHLYLIELKDVSNTSSLRYKEISEKFKTIVDDFFTVKFKEIFDKFKLDSIKFYLLASYPKGAAKLSIEEYREKIKGTVLDVYASQKPFKLYNKIILIEPLPALKISAC